MLPPVAQLRKLTLAWYRRTARPFPWRGEHITPYHILISEIMLQQTQAARVAELMPVFLDVFPTIFDLARASNADVIKQWKGMGYNSRAIRLRDAARTIVNDYGGIVPDDVETMRTLPGFGPYASASVCCFAYNTRTVVVDVNVRRVYSRWMRAQSTTDAVEPENDVRAFAGQVLPRTNPAEWYHAVMDLGATICTARKPLCDVCPVNTLCLSANAMVTVVRSRKPEPSYHGEPNRIWRGRIVQLLRDHHEGLHLDEVRQLLTYFIKEKPHTIDAEWLHTLVKGLIRDRMITMNVDRLRLGDD